MHDPAHIRRGYVVEAHTARRILLVQATSWTEALTEALREVGRSDSRSRLEYEGSPSGSVEAYDPLLGERYVVRAADRGVAPPPVESWWHEPDPDLQPITATPTSPTRSNVRSSMEKLMMGAAAASALLAGAATRLP